MLNFNFMQKDPTFSTHFHIIAYRLSRFDLHLKTSHFVATRHQWVQGGGGGGEVPFSLCACM